MKTNPEISVTLTREVWSLVYDLLHQKQQSLERDIKRADEVGSTDYVQVLIDDVTKCKKASDEISLSHSLSFLQLP